ncbi:dr1-associated corepressor [Vanacampus margaritifer]
MPANKRRFNVRFAPARIKKIMQKNAEVGRIAMAVPVIISRAVEMFLKSLLSKTCLITKSNGSGAVSVAHVKQCIESEKLFHFLKDVTARFTFPPQDNRGLNLWSSCMTKRPDACAPKREKVEEATPRRNLDSLGNDSSSSESELFIRL